MERAPAGGNPCREKYLHICSIDMFLTKPKGCGQMPAASVGFCFATVKLYIVLHLNWATIS